MSFATMRTTSARGSVKIASGKSVARPFVACPARQQRLAPVRASAVVSEIVDKLKTLTLLEASELVKEIEKTFGVDASAPSGGMMMAMAPGAGAAAPAAAPVKEEQTAFDVVLESFDTSKKIVLLKVLRGVTGMGLNETKTFVDSLPKAVKTAVAKDEAEKVLKELADAGGKGKIV